MTANLRPARVLLPALLMAAACSSPGSQGVAEDDSPVHRSGFVEAVSLVADSTTAVLGIRTFEQPEYEVITEDGDFEVRSYPEMIAATTTMSANARDGAGFGRLFDYISGANTVERKVAMTAPVLQADTSRKIAMTAPVLQDEREDGRSMAFILPARYSIENAPRPTDPAVNLDVVPSARFATIRFSGRLRPELIESKTAELRAWMEQRGLAAAGEPMWAGYDPPYTLPALRRNEVWIPID